MIQVAFSLLTIWLKSYIPCATHMKWSTWCKGETNGMLNISLQKIFMRYNDTHTHTHFLFTSLGSVRGNV